MSKLSAEELDTIKVHTKEKSEVLKRYVNDFDVDVENNVDYKKAVKGDSKIVNFDYYYNECEDNEALEVFCS